MTAQLLPASVFLSYRRSVSWASARLIFDGLVARGHEVFMDAEGMNSGKFEDRLYGEISKRDRLVLVVEQGSFDEQRKMDDWLLREIAYAMSCGTVVVPVMINGATIPGDVLTAVPGLGSYQGVKLYPEYVKSALDELSSRFLNDSPRTGRVSPVAGVASPPDAPVALEQTPTRSSIRPRALRFGGVLFAIGTAVVFSLTPLGLVASLLIGCGAAAGGFGAGLGALRMRRGLDDRLVFGAIGVPLLGMGWSLAIGFGVDMWAKLPVAGLVVVALGLAAAGIWIPFLLVFVLTDQLAWPEAARVCASGAGVAVALSVSILLWQVDGLVFWWATGLGLIAGCIGALVAGSAVAYPRS